VVAGDLERRGAERVARALRDGAVTANRGLPRASGDRRDGGVEGCRVDEPGGQRLPQPSQRIIHTVT